MTSPFAEIAVALGIQARELANRAEQNEQVAVAIGLFPNTTAHLVEEWRQQARLVGEAHKIMMRLMPLEQTIRAVIDVGDGANARF